ncbi:M20/M25/M40 family metallo-hydrolase [Pedomonas mirosovicensis]|uniref:M20/M25/M40 family metallo-hydrolase n=1 Tax=Pedomonas mirosovicensis TaxID=2908641 RepID=UPI0035BBB572
MPGAWRACRRTSCRRCASASRSTPPTVNNAELVKTVRAAIAGQMGEGAFVTKPREGMGAEDFAYFVETDPKVPGAYFAVGGTPQAELDAAKNGGAPVPAHHSPLFKITPEPAIKSGIEAMTSAAMGLLAKS